MTGTPTERDAAERLLREAVEDPGGFRATASEPPGCSSPSTADVPAAAARAVTNYG
ncbi:hypothetical protein [Streptomyces sp. NPDC050485]|uniref:hypothetical protein n=1 Tax=Streptomyces sp. NPDC050485 TaxID=3365617 RepID=UPI00378EDFFB